LVTVSLWDRSKKWVKKTGEKMKKTEISEKLYQKCCQYLSGGVGSQVRSAAEPILFFTHGKGSKLYDVDGNEYIDYLLGYGPCILGYNHPTLTKFLKEQIEKGFQFGSETEDTIKLCKKLTKIIPCADTVKLGSTGSDAVHGALRVARAYTGKNKIIKFEGHYHGWLDSVYVSHIPDSLQYWGLKNNPRKLLESAGQPESVLQDLIILPWNDLDILEKTVKERHFEIAAVITEPIMANLGLIMPEKGYLEGLREITKKYDVLLIFDEVITGFRVALGGAQEYFGITPDISTFGKAVGGGVPLGGYGGRKDIMELVAKKKCVEGGTYNTNSLAVSAGLAVLSELEKKGTYENLNNLGKGLMNGMRKLTEQYNIPLEVQGPGEMFGIRFSGEKATDAREAVETSHSGIYPKFRRLLLEKGVHIFPTEKGEFYISTVHIEEDIDKTLNTIDYAMKKLKKEI